MSVMRLADDVREIRNALFGRPWDFGFGPGISLVQLGAWFAAEC